MEHDARAALTKIVGAQYVSDRMADRVCYSQDCGPDKAGIPAVIVRPDSTEEVTAIVEWANEHDVPIHTRGRATTFLGSGVKDDVILIETTRMNRIETIDLGAGYVTAQCGAIWHGIDAVLRPNGWELAVPGGGGLFSCTIGGTVAVNAIPHGATEYGMTGDHVLSLEVVLPTGEVIKTGSAANPNSDPIERGANGPDLTGLFIGAYGILGIITSVSYRLRRIPETEEFRMFAFDDFLNAIDAAEGVQAQDAATFIVGLFGGPKPNGETGDAFLHLVTRDRTVSAEARIREAEAICCSHRGRPRPAEGTRRYWTEHMYSWLRNTAPGPYYSDRPFFCPEVAGFVSTQGLKRAVALFREMRDERDAEFEEYGIRVKGLDTYFARNGAYLWIDTLYDERRDDAFEYALKLRGEIAERMFTEGGMSPGGLGAGVAPYIMPKLGETFGLLRKLKQTMDPKGILNPELIVGRGV
ncbi:FAD-binding oxidoreductase [Candidatus Bipolaricaulota bacterium]